MDDRDSNAGMDRVFDSLGDVSLDHLGKDWVGPAEEPGESAAGGGVWEGVGEWDEGAVPTEVARCRLSLSNPH